MCGGGGGGLEKGTANVKRARGTEDGRRASEEEENSQRVKLI